MINTTRSRPCGSAPTGGGSSSWTTSVGNALENRVLAYRRADMLGAADKAVPTTYGLIYPEFCDDKHARRKFDRCVNISFPVGLTPIILSKTRAASKSYSKPLYTKYGGIGASCMMVSLVVTALWARSGYEYPAVFV